MWLLHFEWLTLWRLEWYCQCPVSGRCISTPVKQTAVLVSKWAARQGFIHLEEWREKKLTVWFYAVFRSVIASSEHTQSTLLQCSRRVWIPFFLYGFLILLAPQWSPGWQELCDYLQYNHKRNNHCDDCSWSSMSAQ